MVLTCKIFLVRKENNLNILTMKLKGFKRELEEEVGGGRVKLVTEIRDLKINDKGLTGYLYRDYIFKYFFRGETKFAVATRKTKFIFHIYNEELYLVVFDKKIRANAVSNNLREALLLEPGGIVEAKITHETLKTLHEENPEATKVIFFDDVDIPNINKLSLYGPSLRDTSLYNEYLSHGKLWYVVFQEKSQEIVLGVTRNSVVTVFSKIDEETFEDYVLRKIIPLTKQEAS